MLEKISKNRSAVMGTAILLIMLYHSKVVLPTVFPYYIVAAILEFGYGGVDIFLFLSGFGIYRTLSRKQDLLYYYKRRIKRILPAYIPALVVWAILILPEVDVVTWPSAMLSNLTGIAFWIQHPIRFNWYILALPSFYLSAPVFMWLLKTKKHGTAIAIFSMVIIDLCFFDSYLMIATSRFTIFVIGMIAGRKMEENDAAGEVHESFVYLVGGAGILVLAFWAKQYPNWMWNYGLYWYPFILIAPAVILLLCRCFSLLDRIWIGRKIRHFMEMCGECSLEIYLIHIIAFEYLCIEENWQWLFIFICMLLSGSIYHDLLGTMMARIAKKTCTVQGNEPPEKWSAKMKHCLGHTQPIGGGVPSGRNGAINAYRFLFAVVIALLHFRYYGGFGAEPTGFRGGYLAVEFFFLTSGFFLMKRIEEQWGKGEGSITLAVWKYAKARYIRLFIPYFLTVTVAMLLRIFVWKNLYWKDYLIHGLYEIFMLQSFGFPYVTLILWYASALLIASVFLYWVALSMKEQYLILLLFFVPGILSMLYQQYGHIDLTMGKSFLVTAGLWRAVAELGAGCLMYQAVKHLKAQIHGRFRISSTVFEMVLLLFILWIMFRTYRDIKDFPLLLLMILFLTSTMLESSALQIVFRHKCFSYLGEVSYAFYLVQAISLQIFATLPERMTYWFAACCFLLGNFILAAGIYEASKRFLS